MDFRRFKLRLLVLPAAAVLMAAAASEAQPPVTNAWQSIDFSSSSNSDTSSNLTSSFPEQPSTFSDLQNRLQMYQDSSPVVFRGSPLAAPAPMPRQVLRIRKPSNDNLAWEFMTPAQIMGVAPDQILQTKEGNANNANRDQSGLTAIERILLGKSPGSNLKAAAAGNVPASASQNFPSDANIDPNGVMVDLISGSLKNMQTAAYGSSVDAAANENLFANRNENSAWSKLFGIPQPAPAPDATRQLQQQEEMKQFMQLLNPRSAAASATTAAPDESTPLKTANAFSDFDSTTPLPNPFGNPFAPLNGNTSVTGGIGKPASLAPLPAITRQANNQSAVRPAWAPQPPPWLSTTPQPFTIPQSKF